MSAYKYKTEEAHQKHLAKRREYYAKNREQIRKRDNANAKRNRQENPERYRLYVEEYRKTHPKPEWIEATLQNNPDRSFILSLF